MMGITFGFTGVLVALIVLLLFSAIRIFREYERGVVFMLGRFWKVKGPGLVLIIPLCSRSCGWTCAPSCSTCRRRT